MASNGEKFKITTDATSEDVATMVRILRSQLNCVMDMTHHIEGSGVLENFYAIPDLTTTDATQLYTYCNELSLRVNQKVWKIYENAGLLGKMEKFFSRVTNYQENYMDAKLLESPTQQLFTAAHAQAVMRNMLDLVTDQCANLENILDERYNQLLQYESNSLPNETRELVADLAAESNRLDRYLREQENNVREAENDLY